MRVLQLTLCTGLLFFLMFMSIRVWSEGQTYRPFETTYWQAENSAEKLIVIPWEQNFFLEKHPTWILWADVYKDENQDLIVKPWADRNVPIRNLEKKTNPARPYLVDLLKKFPNSRWVINCNDNTQDIHLILAKVLTETNATEKVILQSDFNTILISTKQKAPMLLFGSTLADLTRLKIFESLFLLPAAPFKGDVYFGPMTYRSRPTISRDIVLELKKRFKKIILGPLSREEEINQAMELGADGFFLTDPLLWKPEI